MRNAGMVRAMPRVPIQHDPEMLNRLLEDRGWTGADLARATGLSQPSVWSLLKGETKMPKASKLVAVANALGVPLKQILKHPSKSDGDLSESMLSVFNALGPDNQRAILAAATALLKPPKNPS